MEILEQFLDGARGFIPSAITLVIVVFIIIVVRIFLKRGETPFKGGAFQRQLITLALSFIGLMALIMVLPLDDSRRGQLLSLIGILLTAAIALSSTTFLGNIMAGLMLRAVNNFRLGDFIKVGSEFGRVSERGLFHVEIQTENRDLVTLPNLNLVTNSVKVIRSSGTIVSAGVSLGYDTPHSVVEKALLEAASRAGLSESFMQIVELGDFSISYKISGLLTDTKKLITVRSDLREQMINHLHATGIEIVSPTFMNTRAFDINSKFISASDDSDEPERNGKEPEKLLFDKADEAESIETLKIRHEEFKSDLKLLEDEPQGDSSDLEKERHKAKIEGLKARIERVEYLIKLKEDRSKDEK